MKMNGIENFYKKLKRHEIIIGSHVHFDSCFVTEMIGGAGFDFIWIDGEHASLDTLDIQRHVLACRAAGVASIVRAPGGKLHLSKHILDMGADGIVFPMICTKEDAEEAIGNCLYPPRGTRGFGTRRACNYGWDNKSEYLRDADNMIFKVVQIEHIDALRNLESILDVDGISSIVIGPNDFATSMGYIGDPYSHEETRSYLKKIVEITKARGIPVGASIGYNKTAMSFWLDNGVDWIGVGTDMDYIRSEARNALNDTIAMAKERGRVWTSNF